MLAISLLTTLTSCGEGIISDNVSAAELTEEQVIIFCDDHCATLTTETLECDRGDGSTIIYNIPSQRTCEIQCKKVSKIWTFAMYHSAPSEQR
jgi:hypothetical protein